MPEGEGTTAESGTVVVSAAAENATTQTQEPVVPQSQVNKLVGTARQEARAALLKEYGVESKEALAQLIEDARTVKQANQTEAEKAIEEAAKWRAKVEALEAQNKAANLNLLRAKIGREKGLPEGAIELVQGEDEESIAAWIEERRDLFAAAPVPPPNVGDGTRPANAGDQLSPDEEFVRTLAARIHG